MKENETPEIQENFKISPPWIQYSNALTAMFAKDPEVRVVYNNNEPEVRLLVDNQIKADALTELLPKEKKFGNVTLKITVVPSNLKVTKESLIRNAFYGNPALHDIFTVNEIPGMMISNPLTYVIFEKEVVQYWNDNLGDAHGNRSTLYEELAKEIFEDVGGILFCTDNGKDGVGKPLGEWP